MMESEFKVGKPPSLFRLQLLYVLTALFLIATWILLVPRIVRMPEEVAWRVQFYPAYLLPLLAILLIGSSFLLKPVLQNLSLMMEGKLTEPRLASLISRASQYPYHAFLFSLLAVGGTSVVLGVVLAIVHKTAVHLVVELVVLACALGVVFSILTFFIGRATIGSLVRLPGLSATGLGAELGLRKRIVLGVVCAVLVIWAFLGTMMFDTQVGMAVTLAPKPYYHPQVARTAVFMALVGPIVLILSGMLSSYMASDLATDIEAVIGGLENLADQEIGQAERTLPVLSPDELGDLTSSFNRLVTRVAKHDRELRESAERAKEASKKQTDFFSVVSHDLRTPLHSIVGFSQLLLEGTGGCLSADQEEDVHSILSGAYHLLSLVDDLVDFSKIESGMMALSRTQIDIEHVVREAMEAASGLKRGKDVVLQSDVQPNLPPVLADETRMRQIMFNLIGNALKFTKQGKVLVRVGPGPAGFLSVTVEDSGPGIPESQLESVFEEFEQVRSRDSSASKGTGLGLAITMRLVQLHEGDIQVRNRAEGGTAFSFTVPVARL